MAPRARPARDPRDLPTGSGGRRPASSGARLALRLLLPSLLLMGAALAGCRSTPQVLGPPDPAFRPAFEALGQAIEAGDDLLARRTLDGILARGPEGDTLARAEAYGRILEGRRLARALELRLVARPDERDPARVVVELEASHGLEEPLGVRSLPGLLEFLVTGMDPRGLEQRSARSLGVEAVTEFEVHPGRVRRLRLGAYPVTTGTAIAVRASFELVLPSGELEYGGQRYPANALEVRPCSLVRLAPYLPDGPVEPAELVRYLEGERVATPALLERAVRIAPERRAEALELLCTAADGMTRWELERALPALRWLSGNRHLGGDVDAWRRWLEARGRSDPDPGLPVLPEAGAAPPE